MVSSSVDTMKALKFAKLNGANHCKLIFNIRWYQESLDLFEHVDRSVVTPTNTDDNGGVALLTAFNFRAKKAWTHICLAVEPEQQIHVRDTKTAKEGWDALKNQFAKGQIAKAVSFL